MPLRPQSSVSTLARPPIQPHELEVAQDAICVYHRGLITQTGDKVGRVFWCPVGRCYWRYEPEREAGFKTPLRYGRVGI
jgi:hypothetical protein